MKKHLLIIILSVSALLAAKELTLQEKLELRRERQAQAEQYEKDGK
ncbi:MAG: hypothetical protein J6866_05325 [Victivallales bacterium]|nr:hypothetical protein [Victivallales bacterium]